MASHSIAIVGLGRVGTAFMERILSLHRSNVRIIGVCDPADTPGKKLAREFGLPVLSLDELVDLGSRVDVLFELTGDSKVKIDLRNRYFNSRNSHTVILPEVAAHLIWSLLDDSDMPDVHEDQAY